MTTRYAPPTPASTRELLQKSSHHLVSIRSKQRDIGQSRASKSRIEPSEHTQLEVDVVSSLIHTSIRQYAVISVRTVPHCERLVIAYRDEKTLRDLLAAPSIVALGYRSREEAQISIDSCTTAAHPSRRKLTARLIANGTQSFKEVVASRLLSKGKFSLANTKSFISDLLQHTFVGAVVVFYSKNALSAAVRALISF
jgi:hypothetical protein